MSNIINKNWTLEEQKQHRKEWIKALRSAKYKQGKSVLRNKDNEYCCLGVACEVAGHSPKQISVNESDFEDNYPSRDVMNYFGLRDNLGSYYGGKNSFQYSLVNDNDDYEYNFNEISDIIESEPEGLFVNEYVDTRRTERTS